MKKILVATLAATLALSASTAFAGGPIVIVEEPAPVVAEKPRSGWIVPLVLIGIVACVVACGGDDDNNNDR